MKNAIEMADPWNRTCQSIDLIGFQCRTQFWLNLLGQRTVRTYGRYLSSF